MTTPERLAKVAAVLRCHLPKDRYDDDGDPVGTYCTGCDWAGDYFADGEAGPFDDHLAAALSPLLDEFAAQDEAAGAASVIAYPEQVLAEAWDEGFGVGRDTLPGEGWHSNPYRTPQTHAMASLSDAQPERGSVAQDEAALRERVAAACRLAEPDHLTPMGARIILSVFSTDPASGHRDATSGQGGEA